MKLFIFNLLSLIFKHVKTSKSLHFSCISTVMLSFSLVTSSDSLACCLLIILAQVFCILAEVIGVFHLLIGTVNPFNCCVKRFLSLNWRLTV